jgi:hypothetical protein
MIQRIAQIFEARGGGAYDASRQRAAGKAWSEVEWPRKKK